MSAFFQQLLARQRRQTYDGVKKGKFVFLLGRAKRESNNWIKWTYLLEVDCATRSSYLSSSWLSELYFCMSSCHSIRRWSLYFIAVNLFCDEQNVIDTNSLTSFKMETWKVQLFQRGRPLNLNFLFQYDSDQSCLIDYWPHHNLNLSKTVPDEVEPQLSEGN